MNDKKRLGIGFVGSGFVTGFHLQSLVAVRDADVTAITSPTRQHAEAAAAAAVETEADAAAENREKVAA